MEKTIEGTITFKVEIGEKNILVNYNSTIENDLAVLAMGQYMLETCSVGIRETKKLQTGKAKQLSNESLDRVLRGRNAVQTVLGMYIANYEEYMKSIKQNEEKSSEQIAAEITAEIDALKAKQDELNK